MPPQTSRREKNCATLTQTACLAASTTVVFSGASCVQSHAAAALHAPLGLRSHVNTPAVLHRGSSSSVPSVCAALAAKRPCSQRAARTPCCWLRRDATAAMVTLAGWGRVAAAVNPGVVALREGNYFAPSGPLDLWDSPAGVNSSTEPSLNQRLKAVKKARIKAPCHKQKVLLAPVFFSELVFSGMCQWFMYWMLTKTE
ncbi:hypothetical protein AOLI_G00166960 [Acnodon oligacanthus]